MKGLRICRITDAFPPPWSGLGPGPYGLSVAQHEVGNEVVVITKYREGSEYLDSTLPFRVIRSQLKKDLFDFDAFRIFRKLHKKRHFDIIHSHGSSFFWIQYLNSFVKFIDVPIVVSVHNIRDYQNQIYREADMFSLTEMALGRNISKERSAALNNFRKWFYIDGIKQRISYRTADLLLPVSGALSEWLRKLDGIDKNSVVCLPNGVDWETFSDARPAAVHQHGINDDDMILLFVGRLICTKDISSLILSLQYIKEPNVKLLIVGDGPWRDIYHEMVAKKRLQRKVVFIPNVTHQDIAGYYKRADLFVFTSFSEGMPKVVLEAMAAGKPIIGSDVDGVRDIIVDGGNGFLFPPNNPKKIGEKISKIFNEKDLLSIMGQRSSSLVKEKYTWQKVAELCQASYNKVVEI